MSPTSVVIDDSHDRPRSPFHFRLNGLRRFSCGCALVAAMLLPGIALAQGQPDSDVPDEPKAGYATAAGERSTAGGTAVEPPERKRHIGISLGIAPSVGVDVEWRGLYGYASANALWPFIFTGNNEDQHPLAFSAGAGVTFPFTSTTRWHFDLLALVAPVGSGEEWEIGYGVGVGVHCTFRNGFTLAFKLPVAGYSSMTKQRGHADAEVSNSIIDYYLVTAMGLPLLSLGYRF